MKDMISIVVPCYNEEEAIPVFYKEVNKVSQEMKEQDFEFIFIDDGSCDNTLSEIEKLAKKDKRVKFTSFSRNFGKESGLYAGLERAKGNYVTFMDVDLQDPPYLIKEIYKDIKKEEYDCIALYSSEHKDYGFIRKKLTKLWYKFSSSINKTPQKPGARDFRLMNRKMVDALLDFKEFNRFIKGLFSYIGFKVKWVEYDIPDRNLGKTKFNVIKLFRYALEGVLSFNMNPLKYSFSIGISTFIISFILYLFILIKYFIYKTYSIHILVLNTMFFNTSIILIAVGIIGLYLSKMYLEVKNRPIYIVCKTEGDL